MMDIYYTRPTVIGQNYLYFDKPLFLDLCVMFKESLMHPKQRSQLLPQSKTRQWTPNITELQTMILIIYTEGP